MGVMTVLKTSAIQIANNHFPKFESLSSDLHFSILRQVIADLEEASNDDSLDPELISSGYLIQNLFKQILEDITLTTPWDNEGGLKRTREAALLLAKKALGCMAEYNPQNVQHGDILRILNTVKNEYNSLLDVLNAEDRLIILKN